jgi:hypothetical protein
MRFAYIDSQGKEVGIPTVEALQLRIELGAIAPTTMLFDASSDKWAPAGEHEIYRTLRRELVEGAAPGFVAPPHTADRPAAAPPPEPSTQAHEHSHEAPRAEPAAPEPRPTTAPTDEWAPEPKPSAPKPSAPKRSDLDLAGFTLAPIEDIQPTAAELRSADPPREDGFEREIELTSLAQGPFPTASTDIKADLHLESRLAEQDSGGASDWAEVSDLERPLSEYTAEGPPGWENEDAETREPPPKPVPRESLPSDRPVRRRVRENLPETPAEARVPPPPENVPERHDFRSSSAADEASRASKKEPEKVRPGAAPRSRPKSPPKVTRRAAGPSVSSGVLAGALLVVVLGGAGWLGWSFLRGRGEEAPQIVYEEVEIPAIPAELEPTYRELADGAQQDLVARMTELQAAARLPDEPPADWLAGQYLANASRYPEVHAYWTALSEHLASLRGREAELFRDAFNARLASRTMTPEANAQLLGRAEAGFKSALRDRDRSYLKLAAVFDASLSLHDFLLRNEENISFDPSVGDPVLAAVPASKELGDEMWGRVDEITSALEAMDALTERVTTERLFSLTRQGISATPPH